MTALDAALRYAEHFNLAVFPCHFPIINGTARCSCGNPDCSDAAKHPYARLARRGLKDATRDPRTIERWWQGAAYNVAIATGAVSGLIIIDVDPRHGGDASLAALEAENEPLPVTWRAITGSGGEHIALRHPGRYVPSRNGHLAPGIDTKGDGGYVIAPPSQHINGRRYAWSVDNHPDDTELAAMPPWLVDKIVAPAAGPKKDWKAFLAEPIAEGVRHERLKSLAGLLFYRLSREPHLAANLLLAFNQTWCSPPLPEDELLRIIDHAAAREISRRRSS